MSNATSRNFAAGQGERNRRLARMLEGGMPLGSLAVEGDPAWQSFWGSMHDKEAEANAAGMGFRADLGGIGRWAEPSSGGGRLTSTDRAGIAGNIGLGQLVDANRASEFNRRMAEAAAQQAEVAGRDALRHESDIGAIDQAFAAPPRDALTEDPRSARPVSREEQLRMLPPHLRPAFEKQFAAEELAAQKAETDATKAAAELAKATRVDRGTPIWVNRGGKPVRIHEDEYQPGDEPVSASGGDKGPKLSAAAQDDLVTMATVKDLSSSALTLGNEIKWSGTGPVEGRVGALAAQAGIGGEKAEMLRNQLGNIQGTIAKLRGGTAFSEQEKKMLDSYTPTYTDSELKIKAKLKSLDEFIASKRKHTLDVAGGNTGGAGGGSTDYRKKYDY